MLTPVNDQIQRREFEALVICDDDPDGLTRVKVRVFGLMDGVPEDSLPWATYLLPVGARVNSGDFKPAHIGDYVWVDFPYITHGQHDTRRPRVTGSLHFCPDGVPNLPHEAWDGVDRLNHKRTGNEPVPEMSEYHESRVATYHGITTEWERPGVYRITHRASGTAIELTERGDTVIHSENRAFYSSLEETEFESGNGLVINVLSGDAEIRINNGNAMIEASGNAEVKADGAANLEAGQDITLKAGGNINLDAGGGINNTAGAVFAVQASMFTENLG